MKLFGFADVTGWHVPLGTKGFIMSKTVEGSWQHVLDKWGITHKAFRRLPKEEQRKFVKQVEIRELIGGCRPALLKK
jgi:hypothetical protein